MNVDALKEDLQDYHNRLQSDPTGSTEVLRVRDRIARRLGQVMTRTERPHAIEGARHIEFKKVRAPLEAPDIRLFRHLSESAGRPVDRSAVVGYWSSIPYPLQMMDKGYAFAEHKKPVSLDGEARNACISWRKIRRFEPIAHPHPRLRSLLDEVPCEFLALPWIPPTLKWWPLAGIFSEAMNCTGGDTSKALLFSRFRAVPRAIASVLSYEAERYCFSLERQRSRGVKPIAYEYRTEKGNQPLAGLFKRPSPSFTFPGAANKDMSMRTLLMFFPLPELARLGDPLTLTTNSEPLTLEQAIHVVQKRIISKLGIASEKRTTEAVWPWALRIQRSTQDWKVVKTAFTSWSEQSLQRKAEDEDRGVRGVDQAVRQLLAAKVPTNSPTQRDVRILAELALLAPGNVLYRAVQRVFGKRNTSREKAKRLSAVTSASVVGLRTYLDLPDFHLLLRSRQDRQHPAAIRRAIWDGNLEAVLDEYLATLAGLGSPSIDISTEEKVLTSVAEALNVGAVAVSANETGTSHANRAFRIRCHAALPFGLGAQEKETGTGELRSDSLRVSFNSPFRPHVLATTSIGQEGLDFHLWANRIIHWDLPSNPVDLEQRDGRVDRYASLAVRQSIAARGAQCLGTQSPWRTLAESQQDTLDGLSPWWVAGGAAIHRIIFVPPYSKMDGDLQLLRDALSLYRLTLGQADQEALIHALHRRVSEAGEEESKVFAWFENARIDLSPKGVLSAL